MPMSAARGYADFTAGGYMVEGGSLEPCTVVCAGGMAEIDRSEPDRCDFSAVFIRDMVNAHTHCGDYGLKVPPGLTVEELVAPPDGLKHRYLSSLDSRGLEDNIRRFDSVSAGHGTASFVDFREGGLEGCRALRRCSRDAIVLGRPVSKEYDPDEIAGILSVADGIGISSISDIEPRYLESVADDVRRERKMFALHASERVREDIDAILSLDPTFIIHMCEATGGDLAKCAEAEVPIVVCPTSNAYYGKETPIVRMLENDADVMLGTDNGMLCEPDLISEAGVFSELVSRQGGDPGEAWKALANSSKLLNRTTRMEYQTKERYLTVVPQGDNGTSHAMGPFRVQIRRRSEWEWYSTRSWSLRTAANIRSLRSPKRSNWRRCREGRSQRCMCWTRRS